MIFGLIALLASLAVAQAAVSVSSAKAVIASINSPLLEDPVNQILVEEAIQIAADNNCNPNICYAVDGSGSISEDEFQRQLDFVKIITGAVSFDPDSQFAAVQYGLSGRRISTLTKNHDKFLLDVASTLQLRSPRTFIAPGIIGCMRLLNRIEDEPRKIILLGDGRSTFDSRDPPLDPPSIAQTFLADPNNSISAVAVSFPNTDMLEAITGNPDRVFMVADWYSVLDVIGNLVEQVCGIDAVEF